VKDLKEKSGKLLLANGKESNKEAPQYLGNVMLGKEIGVGVKIFSGAHVGFASHPPEFAKELTAYLKERE